MKGSLTNHTEEILEVTVTSQYENFRGSKLKKQKKCSISLIYIKQNNVP